MKEIIKKAIKQVEPRLEEQKKLLNLKDKVLEKIKYLDKSEYVLRPDFINSLRLFN